VPEVLTSNEYLLNDEAARGRAVTVFIVTVGKIVTLDQRLIRTQSDRMPETGQQFIPIAVTNFGAADQPDGNA